MAAAAGQRWLGWIRTERTLRESRALPGPALSTVITAGVAVVVGLVGLGWPL